MSPARILLTNDDGIDSPGLWAAASVLAELGKVTVVAPQQQWSGAGRGLPPNTSGVIRPIHRAVGADDWTAYAVDGSPAQAVLFGLLELLPAPPDLVVAGINAGENLGRCITISGTVGAAMEAAAAGIPALAISLEMPVDLHRANSHAIDYSTAAFFCKKFCARILNGNIRHPDVAVWKVDVPANATCQTGWSVTRVGSSNYYASMRPIRGRLDEPVAIPYVRSSGEYVEPDSDIHAVKVQRIVSISPLSLDLSSRVNRAELQVQLSDP